MLKLSELMFREQADGSFVNRHGTTLSIRKDDVDVPIWTFTKPNGNILVLTGAEAGAENYRLMSIAEQKFIPQEPLLKFTRHHFTLGSVVELLDRPGLRFTVTDVTSDTVELSGVDSPTYFPIAEVMRIIKRTAPITPERKARRFQAMLRLQSYKIGGPTPMGFRLSHQLPFANNPKFWEIVKKSLPTMVIPTGLNIGKVMKLNEGLSLADLSKVVSPPRVGSYPNTFSLMLSGGLGRSAREAAEKYLKDHPVIDTEAPIVTPGDLKTLMGEHVFGRLRVADELIKETFDKDKKSPDQADKSEG